MKIKILLLLSIFGLLSGGQVYAIGLGFTSGSADEEWTNSTGTSGAQTREVTNSGFILDTATASNRVFNYRLSLLSEENKNSATGSFSGFTMTHDFGFALIKNRIFRLWFGPRLNFAFLDNDNANANNSGRLGILYGPVVGVNIHLPRVVTFSITAGELRGTYEGECVGFDCSSNDEESDTTFMNLSVIFRLGRDNY